MSALPPSRPFLQLPAINLDDPARINAVVDTPKASRHKYKYDEQLGLFRLERVLAAGLVFPYNFGYIPSTLGEDGDPVDVLLLDEIEHFFIAYTSIQGKRFTPQRRSGPERARRRLAQGMKAFENKE